MKKRHILLITVLLVTAILYYRNKNSKISDSAAAPYQIEQNYVVYASGEGQLKPGREIFLTVNKGGKLDKLNVKEGDNVTKGQVIGIVDETDRTAGLKSALSSFRLASSDYGRIQRLYQSRSTTLQDLDEARQRFDVRKSELEKAKELMEDGILRSPADGKLSLMAFSVGDIIPDGGRVGVIEDHTFYEVVVKLPAELRRIMPQQALVEMKPQNHLNGNNGVKVSLNADISLPNPGSDFDGMYFDARLTFNTPLQDLGGINVRDAVFVKFPIVTYREAVIVDRSSLVWDENRPKLQIFDKNGNPSWFEPELGVSPSDDKAIILNLPKEVKIVLAPSQKDIQKLGKKM